MIGTLNKKTSSNQSSDIMFHTLDTMEPGDDSEVPSHIGNLM